MLAFIVVMDKCSGSLLSRLSYYPVAILYIIRHVCRFQSHLMTSLPHLTSSPSRAFISFLIHRFSQAHRRTVHYSIQARRTLVVLLVERIVQLGRVVAVRVLSRNQASVFKRARTNRM